jgi:L-rhamnose mutarotase
MSDNADFIAYCLEEYKAANSMTGKEVIALFKKYNIIDYVISCYGALHTMGGLAIAEDIHSLIDDIKKRTQAGSPHEWHC